MAGEMSLSKPFLEGDKDQLLVMPKIRGPTQMLTQGSDLTSGPVTLQCLIQSGARAALTTGATLSGLSLVS